VLKSAKVDKEMLLFDPLQSAGERRPSICVGRREPEIAPSIRLQCSALRNVSIKKTYIVSGPSSNYVNHIPYIAGSVASSSCGHRLVAPSISLRIEQSNSTASQ
jgi:hypothetical protein